MSIRYAHQKKDDNHAAIVARFRLHGCSVEPWGTDGAPDLAVGVKGVTILVEVKDGKKAPAQRKLTPKQAQWHQRWRGAPVYIAECVEDVPTILGMAMDDARIRTPDELADHTRRLHKAAVDAGEVTPDHRNRGAK